MYVLIILYGFGFANIGIPGVATQEFTNLENCKKAGEQVIAIGNTTAPNFAKYVCVKK